MKRSSAELIRESLYHLNFVCEYLTRGELTDQMVIDAISLRLAAGIEAIGKLPKCLREEHFGDTWKLIRATRNTIVHNYGGIDADRIRATASRDIPLLVRTLESAFRNLT